MPVLALTGCAAATCFGLDLGAGVLGGGGNSRAGCSAAVEAEAASALAFLMAVYLPQAFTVGGLEAAAGAALAAGAAAVRGGEKRRGGSGGSFGSSGLAASTAATIPGDRGASNEVMGGSWGAPCGALPSSASSVGSCGGPLAYLPMGGGTRRGSPGATVGRAGARATGRAAGFLVVFGGPMY
jgi:hypothetical protein